MIGNVVADPMVDVENLSDCRGNLYPCFLGSVHDNHRDDHDFGNFDRMRFQMSRVVIVNFDFRKHFLFGVSELSQVDLRVQNCALQIFSTLHSNDCQELLDLY